MQNEPSPVPNEKLAALGRELDRVRAAKDALHAELREEIGKREAAERCIASLACMLGWLNVPPQRVLEGEISALKARAEALRNENVNLQAELIPLAMALRERDEARAEVAALLPRMDADTALIARLRQQAAECHTFCRDADDKLSTYRKALVTAAETFEKRAGWHRQQMALFNQTGIQNHLAYHEFRRRADDHEAHAHAIREVLGDGTAQEEKPTRHAFDCGAGAICLKCSQHVSEHDQHAPTCPYLSRDVAKGNAFVDCNCKEDWSR